MKKLCHVYGKTAQELCAKVNELGVEPIAVLPAGAGQRAVAYYYGEAPKKAEAPKPEVKAPEEPKKAEAPKPAATKAKAAK